jgi:hypothetical protein
MARIIRPPGDNESNGSARKTSDAEVSPFARDGDVRLPSRRGRVSRCDGCCDSKSRRRRCPAAFLLAGIIRQRYHPMNEMKQLSPADMLDQMLVFVGALTERAVVIPERY